MEPKDVHINTTHAFVNYPFIDIYKRRIPSELLVVNNHFGYTENLGKSLHDWNRLFFMLPLCFEMFISSCSLTTFLLSFNSSVTPLVPLPWSQETFIPFLFCSSLMATPHHSTPWSVTVLSLHAYLFSVSFGSKYPVLIILVIPALSH